MSSLVDSESLPSSNLGLERKSGQRWYGGRNPTSFILRRLSDPLSYVKKSPWAENLFGDSITGNPTDRFFTGVNTVWTG